MEVFKCKIESKEDILDLDIGFNPQVIFLFVSLNFKDVESVIEEIKAKYEKSIIIGGTTSGEIIDQEVIDDTVVLAAVKFHKTKLKLYSGNLSSDSSTGYSSGEIFAKKIDQENLKHIFLLSDAQTLSAANLLKGMNNELKPSISVTGGLASRNSFTDSNFIIDNGKIKQNSVIALALYGDSLQVSYNAQGGWDSYGVECLVTKSRENRILEINEQPALNFYRAHVDSKVLENFDDDGFNYPIKVRNEEHSFPVMRVLLAVDQEEESLIMSEEISVGSYVRLMKGNIDRLINGAENSAKIIAEQSNHNHQLAILISCSGRRKVMGELVSEEIEAVTDQFPKNTETIGFYSYGEISPFFGFSKTSLHNLTMCITTFSEL